MQFPGPSLSCRSYSSVSWELWNPLRLVPFAVPPRELTTRFDFIAHGQLSHSSFLDLWIHGLARNPWMQDSAHERECIRRSQAVLRRQRSASTAFRGFRPGRFRRRRFWAARPVRSVSSSSSSSKSSSRSLPAESRPSSCFRARNH